jgi:hypothetical protein
VQNIFSVEKFLSQNKGEFRLSVLDLFMKARFVRYRGVRNEWERQTIESNSESASLQYLARAREKSIE